MVTPTTTPQYNSSLVRILRRQLDMAGQNRYSSVLQDMYSRYGMGVVSAVLNREDVYTPTQLRPTPTPKITPIATKAAVSTAKSKQPWYMKVPVLKQGLQGLGEYQEHVVAPFSGALGLLGQEFMPGEQSMEKAIREYREKTGQSRWLPSAGEYKELGRAWTEDVKIPWYAKLPVEFAADPLTYVTFGAGSAATQGILKPLVGVEKAAAAAEKVATAENLVNRVAGAPFEAALGVAKGSAWIGARTAAPAAEKALTGLNMPTYYAKHFAHPLTESRLSRVGMASNRVRNALHQMQAAGPAADQKFSETLQGLYNKAINPKLLSAERDLTGVLAHPKYVEAIDLLTDETAGTLKSLTPNEWETVMRIADDDKGANTVVEFLANRQRQILASKLGVKGSFSFVPGRAQAFTKTASNLWRHAVLTTPYYLLQNFVENPFRLIVHGINPFHRPSDFLDSPVFQHMAMEDKAKLLAVFRPGKGAEVAPETLGITAAMAGSMPRKYEPLGVAMKADSWAFGASWKHGYESSMSILSKDSTNEVNIAVDAMMADPYVKMAIQSGAVPQEMMSELGEYMKNHEVGDVLAEINRLRDRSILARPITELEQDITPKLQAQIERNVGKAISRGDVAAVHRELDRAINAVPQHIMQIKSDVLSKAMRESARALKVNKKVSGVLEHLMGYGNEASKFSDIDAKALKMLRASNADEFTTEAFKVLVESHNEVNRLAYNTAYLKLRELYGDDIDGMLSHLDAYQVEVNKINKALFDEHYDLASTTHTTGLKLANEKNATKRAAIMAEYSSNLKSALIDEKSMAQWRNALATGEPTTDTLYINWHRMSEIEHQAATNGKLSLLFGKDNTLPKLLDGEGNLLTESDIIRHQKEAIDSMRRRIVGNMENKSVNLPPKTAGGLPLEPAMGLPAPKPIEGMGIPAPTPLPEGMIPPLGTHDALLSELAKRYEDAATPYKLKLQHNSNLAAKMAADTAHRVWGDFSTRNNLDELMQACGVPFWFFPSRSVPFYLDAMARRPALTQQIYRTQQEVNSQNPQRLAGMVKLPGGYYYNPFRALMVWQMAVDPKFTPTNLSPMGESRSFLQSKMGIGLGPQWQVADAVISRLVAKNTGNANLPEPSAFIPQQRWLDALEKTDLPVLKQLGQATSEPFDMITKGVYGEEVANWQKVELEKYLIDAGIDPQAATDKDLRQAWKRYATRELASIPGGAVKVLTKAESKRLQDELDAIDTLPLSAEDKELFKKYGSFPMTGQRQDYIEAIYGTNSDQALWKNLRPVGLTQATEPLWQDWKSLQIAMTNASTERQTKQTAWDAGLKSGSITISQWKEYRKQGYATMRDKITEAKSIYADAPQTPEAWDTFRQKLGWKTSVRNPDDQALDEYYNLMSSNDFMDANGQFDYDAFEKVVDPYLSQLSPDTSAYLQSRLERHKTNTELAYRRDMESIQGYYDIEDKYVARLPANSQQAYQLAKASPELRKLILSKDPLASSAAIMVKKFQDIFWLQHPDLYATHRYWS